MRAPATYLALFVSALASGCMSPAQKSNTNLMQFEGQVPDDLASFFANAKTGKSAIKWLDGISNESLRAMSDTHLAALLGVLDDFEGKNILVGVNPFSPSMDRTDLARQVFRVLTSHMGPGGASVADLDTHQQEILHQDPAKDLSPADQGHVRAILTRMPTEGAHLIEGLRGQDKVRIKKWSTRKLTPGNVKGLLDYVHALTGTKAATGSEVQFIANGGMAPGFPPGTHLPNLNEFPPQSDRAQEIAAQLREVPFVDGEPLSMNVVDPQGALPRLLTSIQKAQRGGPPVWINAFAFQSDDTGWKLAKAMAEAKHRGCDVRLAYDPYGSRNSNNYLNFFGEAKQGKTHRRIYQFLRDNGVPTLPFPVGSDDGFWAWLLKDYLSHVKDYVAGSDLYMGGRNAGDEYYALWQDGSFQLNGPVVADGQRLFAEVWNYSRREVLRRERKDHKSLSNNAFENHIRRKYGDVSPISPADLQNASQGLAPIPGASTDPYSSPTVILHTGHQDRNSRETQMAAAEIAVRRYGIETPYGSDPRMSGSLVHGKREPLISGKRDPHVNGKMGSLMIAKDRMGAGGVVEAIFPAFNDVSEEYYAMQRYYEQLLNAGVKVYEYTGKPMNHSKLEVADDVVVGGSSNMDARSWVNDNENIFIIHDKALADKVWARFEDDKRNSIEITREVLKQRNRGFPGVQRRLREYFWTLKWIIDLL